MKPCKRCDGDGYTERFNDDQSDVVIELCHACAATGFENAEVEIEPPDFWERAGGAGQ